MDGRPAVTFVILAGAGLSLLSSGAGGKGVSRESFAFR